MSGNNLWYLNGDVGAVVQEFAGKRGRFDLFAGFQYWREKHVVTGITQVECTTSPLNPSWVLGSRYGAIQRPIGDQQYDYLGVRPRGWGNSHQIDPRISVDARVAMLLSYLG
ncbi:MAG: hypothetical protein U0361_23250 [Nitrospiraceae bacterium]